MEKTQVDILWILTSSALVFVMRAGFAMLESGLVRSKNSINVAVKVLSDLGISLMVFWPIGFGLMFGSTWKGFFGADLFIPHFSTVYAAVFFIFHAMFTSTSATIVSGAVAERIKYSAYLLVTLVFSALIYPVFGHWAWSTGIFGGEPGWLVKLGFVDFAGCTVVHSVGGWMSVAVLLVLGPRIGRYNQDGSVNRVVGSNTQTAVVGTILLWFGWLGFNGGSTLSMDQRVPAIILNTCLSGAAGFTVTLIVGWFVRGFPDVGLVVNGALAGLVAVTASCAYVSELKSMIIGAIGGVVMLAVEWLIDRLRIDDAVGAIPVHLGAGVWGTLAVGIFADPILLGTGLSRTEQLLVQIAGIAAAAIWAFGVAFAFIWTLNKFFPIRVSHDDETQGLNISEHRASTEIYDLYNSMEEQSKTGDLSMRVHEEPFTEMGQIARKYNNVITTLEENLMAKSDYLSILDNVTDGLFLMDREGRIGPYYSAALEKIFLRKSLACCSFNELLEGLISEEDMVSFNQYHAILFDENISAVTIDRVNPFKRLDIHIDDMMGSFVTKNLEINFQRIMSEKSIGKVMVLVRDKTSEHEMSEKMNKDRERRLSEMEMFYRILHIDPAMFIEYLGSLEENIGYINAALEDDGRAFTDVLDDIYRYAHAIKGDASLFELDFIGEKAHLFEEKIMLLKKKTDVRSEDFLSLAVLVSELRGAASRMRSIVEQLLNFHKSFSSHNSAGEELIMLSVSNIIKRLSKELGKKVSLDVGEFEVLNIPRQMRKKIKDILVQLARNSICHGIELPAKRTSAGKPESGIVRIKAYVSDGKLRLSYYDDGRGIDFDAVKKKAMLDSIKEDDNSITKEKLVELMFAPGFSTSETVDMNSGRGAGMYLVRKAMKELGGNMVLRTMSGSFCEFDMSFPLTAKP